jgi:hypothetical protein
MKQELEIWHDKKAKFSCYVDGVMEYHLFNKDVKFIFHIIADDNFIDEMPPEWLLDLKRITYFSLDIYLLNIDNEWEHEWSDIFNIIDLAKLN